MFASVSRRLAVLNAGVVIVVIALVGLGTALTLRRGLDREESNLLARRADAAAASWDTRFLPYAASSDPGDVEPDGDEEHDDDDHQAREALEGGDVVLYGLDATGRLLVNERGFTYPELPDSASVQAALAGERDERVVDVNGERVRLLSIPVRGADGELVGVIQAARGESLYAKQLRLAIYASLVGILIGAVVAPISGWFLARRAMQPIDDAFARQRTFVADASHELRTPLAVIRANVELIQRIDHPTPEEIETETDRIVEEIDGMTRLVNDLLFLARIDERDRGLFAHEAVSLASLLAAESPGYAARAEAAGLSFSTRIESDGRVLGDPDQLRRLIRILLDNAIGYTPAGGSVEASLSDHGNEIRLSVKDTGVGIAEKDRERLFDRFYRADAARARRSGGAGLGLPIAKSIIEAHRGSISVESSPGAGAIFTVVLPRRERGAAEPKRAD
jgi:signal transduction histidine kinase